jgi:amino acid transporter
MKLKKDLGLLGVFCVSSGAMISSGIFILPGLAFAKAGPGIILSYLLAAVLVLPAMFSKAELATAMPKAGGTYFFIGRTFGPAFGTLGGMASWFSISLKSAFALIGIGEFAVLIWPEITLLQVKLISLACCILFILVNIRGVGHAGKAQIAMVLILIGTLIVYAFAGLSSVDATNFVPLVPFGSVSILGTAGLVFVSYGGLTKVASVAEEVKDPGRNIPLGLCLSLGVIAILYMLVIFVTVGNVDGSILKNSLVPISIGAEKILGAPGLIILSLAGMLAFITTANAGIMTASRNPLAMSRDMLLPKLFGKMSSRFRTPHYSIIVTGLFIAGAILFLDIEGLVKMASTLIILLFIFVNLSVIIMREARIQNYQPKFKSPLYPWMQIFGILGCLFLMFEMGALPLLISALFLAASFVWYWFYASKTVGRESAFLCLIQRIADRQLTGNYLGSELREILRERDDVVEDRFDKLVRRCPIIDIAEPISIEELFRRGASALSQKLNTDISKLEKMFLEREMQSTTVITPGLAIPHVIIEGSGVFELALIRCNGGVSFPGAKDSVHAVFIMVGSHDERNFHLRALMAIAQIAQDKDFLKRWSKSRTVESLRDLILLGERKRSMKEENNNVS